MSNEQKPETTDKFEARMADELMRVQIQRAQQAYYKMRENGLNHAEAIAALTRMIILDLSDMK